MFDYIEYKDNIELSNYLLFDSPTVCIPPEIHGKPVTSIGHDCFFNHHEIISISFPDTLTSIGDNAFALCKSLKELVLPDGISDIGIWAFRDCTGLKKVVMPSKLRILRSGVFSFCYFSDDVEIILNEGLESIEAGVFSCGGLCSGLKLNIPNSVKTIAPSAFEYGMKINTSLPYDEKWFAE